MDPATVADPFPAYERLRGQGRVVSNGLISATVEHALVNEVLRSDDFITAPQLPGPLQWVLDRTIDDDARGPIDPPSLLAVDGEQHSRYRKLVARAFTARKVTRMGDAVESVAERLLDDLERSGVEDFDLIERYAAQLPLAVIGDLLGVPDEIRPRLLEWGNLAAVTLDPALTWRQFREADRALRAMHAWFAEHVAAVRRNPGEDLLSQVALVEGPDALDEIELHMVGLLVLGAGFETTVNLIGNAVTQLDRHPEQRDRLIADPDGWANAVDEVLRYDSPVQLTLRIANADVQVGDRLLAKGDGILLVLGGANRDPAVFDEPQSFDVTRVNAAEHTAFSAGAHFCMGASLARLETAVGLRCLYERYPDLRLASGAVRRPTRILRGWEHLPVRV